MALSHAQKRRRKKQAVALASEMLAAGKLHKDIREALCEKFGVKARAARDYIRCARDDRGETPDPDFSIRKTENERVRQIENMRARAMELYTLADTRKRKEGMEVLYLRTLQEARAFDNDVAKRLHYFTTPPDRMLSQAPMREKLIGAIRDQSHCFTESDMSRIELFFAEERARRRHEGTEVESRDIPGAL